MKRETAFRYCHDIHKKLCEIEGRLFTPGHNREYVDFIKISVVGSFVKGKAFPNDLDLLIEYNEGGKQLLVDGGGILDKEYFRRYGMKRTKLSATAAFIWLTKGMKNVHRLSARDELTNFDVTVEIYPSFKLTDSLQ